MYCLEGARSSPGTSQTHHDPESGEGKLDVSRMSGSGKVGKEPLWELLVLVLHSFVAQKAQGRLEMQMAILIFFFPWSEGYLVPRMLK